MSGFKLAGISEAPDWFINLVNARQIPGQLSFADNVLVIREGNRNSRLFEIGCELQRAGAPFDQVQATLLSVNAQCCQPPLPTDEVKAISINATKYKRSSSKAAAAITGDHNSLRWFPFDTVSWRRNHYVFAMKAHYIR